MFIEHYLSILRGFNKNMGILLGVVSDSVKN